MSRDAARCRRFLGEGLQFLCEMRLVGVAVFRREPWPSRCGRRPVRARRPDGSARCADRSWPRDRVRIENGSPDACGSSRSRARARRSALHRRCAPAGDRRIRFRVRANGWRDRLQNPRPDRSGSPSRMPRRAARARPGLRGQDVRHVDHARGEIDDRAAKKPRAPSGVKSTGTYSAPPLDSTKTGPG